MTKTQPKPRPSVAVFLAKADKSTSNMARCITCRDAKVTEACKEFLALRASGKAKTWQTWRWFVDNYVRKELGADLGYATIMNHVRNCMGARS